MAFGLGLGMAQRTNIIASVVDPHEIGIASSILSLARNIAGAFGIAIFGTILSNSTENYIIKINRFSTLHSHTLIDIQKYIALITLKAQVDAYSNVFLISSIVVCIGGFLAFFIKVKNEKTNVTVHVE